jgi:DNA polymerase III gamma/tau subunit
MVRLPMSDTSLPLVSALQRLSSAVDLLDAAAARRFSAERSDASRATELELMRGDRAKLAELLDQALARGRTLETVNQDIAARVDRAIALVQGALAQTPASEDG